MKERIIAMINNFRHYLNDLKYIIKYRREFLNELRQMINNLRQFLKDENFNISIGGLLMIIVVIKAAKYLFMYCLYVYPIHTIAVILISLLISNIGIYIKNKYIL
jgi:hypothetical protein